MEAIPIECDLKAIRLCVELGFVQPSTLAEWADAVIAAEERPDPDFCELALAARKRNAEILDLLVGYRNAKWDLETWEKVLAWTTSRIRAGELDVGYVVKRIVLLSSMELSEELYLAFVCLEDDYACARDGIFGSLVGIRESVLESLDRFGRPGALRRTSG